MFLVYFLGFIRLLLLSGGVVLGLLAWRELRASLLLGRPASCIKNLRPGLRKVRGEFIPLSRGLHGPAANRGLGFSLGPGTALGVGLWSLLGVIALVVRAAFIREWIG